MPAHATARLARLIPITPSPFDPAATNPEAIRVRDSARKLWAWQAERFEYESRDGGDPAFLLQAGRACRAAAGPGAPAYLEIEPFPFAKLTPAARGGADCEVPLDRRRPESGRRVQCHFAGRSLGAGRATPAQVPRFTSARQCLLRDFGR